MAKNKRSMVERRQHRRIIVQLLIAGWTQQQIAEKLGLSRQQISYDLQVVQKEWKEQTAFDLDGHKLLQLAKLDQVERRAWEGYEDSKKRLKTGDGNPQFLDRVLTCIDRRCKILGLYAPERIEGNGRIVIIDSLPARGVDESKL